MNAPKVFVSHASEDKDRFVLRFAERLRQRGIDAWVDKWEILPGDSLVDKIFEEGLKKADAIIVVLSKVSVLKPWVKEELNAGIVRKIASHTKIIPVVIDDCEVPEALKSTVWERIQNLDTYDSELERIVASIFEHRQKPDLGSPPQYATAEIELIHGLTRIDNLVLKTVGDIVFREDATLLSVEAIFKDCEGLGISHDHVIESLEVLENRGLMELTRSMQGIGLVKMTTFGKDKYASAYIEEYEEVLREVALEIINNGGKSKCAMTQKLGIPAAIVDLVLQIFSDKRWIRLIRTMDDVHLINVSPMLKRAFIHE